MMTSQKFLLAAAAAAAATGCSGDKAVQQPNIVYLMFDDLGYGDLGCYGQEKIETPNIDALAAQGILFTDMYSAAPISAPSRCCILTGKHMGHSQIRDNQSYYRQFAPVAGDENLGWNRVFVHPEQQGQQPFSQHCSLLPAPGNQLSARS